MLAKEVQAIEVARYSNTLHKETIPGGYISTCYLQQIHTFIPLYTHTLTQTFTHKFQVTEGTV